MTLLPPGISFVCLWPQDISTSSGSVPFPNIALDIVDFTEIVSNNDNVMPSIVFQPLNVQNITELHILI